MLGCVDKERGLGGSYHVPLSSFLGSSLLKNGISLSEAAFLCLSSDKAARLWATCHPVGKKNNSSVCQKYLQCHRDVDEGVHTTDQKGCWELVASTDKRAGVQNFRGWCECWEGRHTSYFPCCWCQTPDKMSLKGGRVCCGLQFEGLKFIMGCQGRHAGLAGTWGGCSQRTDCKWGWAIEPQAHFSGPLAPTRLYLPPKASTASPNGTTSWRTSVQIHSPVEDISHQSISVEKRNWGRGPGLTLLGLG